MVGIDRGDLNQQKTAIDGTPVREEDCGLDPLGNWTEYVQKTSGTTVLDQERMQNQVNETTDISETTGPAWITPTHDLTGLPKPSSPADGLDCVYDACGSSTHNRDAHTGRPWPSDSPGGNVANPVEWAV